MNMTKISILLSLILLLGHFRPLFGQEQLLKDFAEERKDRKLCFYPSTLRMVNLNHNPDFNDLVSGIEKLLIYNLDSATRATDGYKQIIAGYQALDFEEFASVYGGGINFYVYGKEGERVSEFIGIISSEYVLTAFYLKGRIALSNIPRLIWSVSEGDMINPFNFNFENFGKSTQGR